MDKGETSQKNGARTLLSIGEINWTPKSPYTWKSIPGGSNMKDETVKHLDNNKGKAHVSKQRKTSKQDTKCKHRSNGTRDQQN